MSEILKMQCSSVSNKPLEPLQALREQTSFETQSNKNAKTEQLRATAPSFEYEPQDIQRDCSTRLVLPESHIHDPETPPLERHQ